VSPSINVDDPKANDLWPFVAQSARIMNHLGFVPSSPPRQGLFLIRAAAGTLRDPHCALLQTVIAQMIFLHALRRWKKQERSLRSSGFIWPDRLHTVRLVETEMVLPWA
jgi:hypothetical protein